MASTMQIAGLDFLPAATDASQRVAVLEAPGRIVTRYAAIPEPPPAFPY